MFSAKSSGKPSKKSVEAKWKVVPGHIGAFWGQKLDRCALQKLDLRTGDVILLNSEDLW
jgi:hypothetical protein